MKTSDLGDRSTYLGATDIAAIVGVSPYRAPIDVWREKVEGVSFQGNTATAWGLRLEEAICDGFTAEKGIRLIRHNEIVVKPHIRFHPDRYEVGVPGVFDAKSGMDTAGYGEPDTDQVPAHVKVQAVLYAGGAKRLWTDIAHLGGQVWRKGLVPYRVPADPELYAALIEEADRWWFAHVVTKEPPAADGSESYRNFLRERYPKDSGLELIATPEQAPLIEELVLAEAEKKKAEERVTALKNRIGEVMGAASVLHSPAGRVDWKEQTRKAYSVAESTTRVMRLYPNKRVWATEEAA